MDLIFPRRDSHVARLWMGAAAKATGDWLLRQLNAALTEPQVRWHEPPPLCFRMSGCGNPCARSVAFAGLGHDQVYPSRVLRIFATGRAIEHEIVAEMAASGLLIDTNKKCEIKSLPLTGHYDVRLKDAQAPDEEIVGEIKSIKDERYDALPDPRTAKENMALLINHGYRGYMSQLNMYIYAMALTRGFLLFESKNTQRRRIYWVELDLGLVDACLEVHRLAWNYVKLRQLAPRTRDIKRDPVCKQCWRRYLCDVLPEGAVDYDDVRAADDRCRA
jgi:hypothetical protein